MRTLTLSLAGAFLLGLFSVASSPAQAEGDCAYGHKTKTAQSSSSSVAQGDAPQTPKPDSGS